jgi:hypothetical protein
LEAVPDDRVPLVVALAWAVAVAVVVVAQVWAAASVVVPVAVAVVAASVARADSKDSQ